MNQHRQTHANGLFVAIAGPSGAGKDSVIDYVRKHANPLDRLVFLRRTVTRPEDAGGERHISVETNQFGKLRDKGAFAITWEAHGLSYGLPISADSHYEAGNTVIANVSRTVLEPLAKRYANFLAIIITAPDDILRDRLIGRGREDSADVAQRLERQPDLPADLNLIEIDNSGPVKNAGEAFLTAIREQMAPA